MTPWLPPYWPNVSFCIFAKLNKPQIKAFRKALWPATALKSIPAHSSDNFISDPVAHTLQSVWMKYVLHLATDWNTNYARCESLSPSLSRLNTITLATPHWTSAPPSRCLQPVQWLIAKCLNLIVQGNNLYTHHHPCRSSIFCRDWRIQLRYPIIQLYHHPSPQPKPKSIRVYTRRRSCLSELSWPRGKSTGQSDAVGQVC